MVAGPSPAFAIDVTVSGAKIGVDCRLLNYRADGVSAEPGCGFPLRSSEFTFAVVIVIGGGGGEEQVPAGKWWSDHRRDGIDGLGALGG
jgi:hypothetical protein